MHDHHHAPGHSHAGPAHAGPGHNTPPIRPRQWQTPHLHHDHHHEDHPPREPDLDLVEAAFAEGFATASDPTSFLRLAGIPFTAKAEDGHTLSLLRVELQQTTDIGSITPHLGGGSFRYDPLPARLVGKRKQLRFVYFDGHGARMLTLEEAKGLAPT